MRVACGACAPVVVIDFFISRESATSASAFLGAPRTVGAVVAFSRRGSMLLGARVWRSLELALKARGPS